MIKEKSDTEVCSKSISVNFEWHRGIVKQWTVPCFTVVPFSLMCGPGSKLTINASNPPWLRKSTINRTKKKKNQDTHNLPKSTNRFVFL